MATLPNYSPPRNGPCLCGSGLAFKRCCVDRLPGSIKLGTGTTVLLNEKKYREALISCRADLTQYTIWHRKHTEPALQAGMPRVGSPNSMPAVTLLEVDVRAMADIVDTLLHCYIAADKFDEFPAVLERLRSNIKDDMWQRKIIYFHALHALHPGWKRPAGRRELKKLGGLIDTDDIDTLQVYLDLFSSGLTFSEQEKIIDRIIGLSKKLSDRLHYRGAKAVLYFTISDFKRAELELDTAIGEVNSRDGSLSLTTYEKYRYANVLEFLGSLRGDEKLSSKALSLYRELLHQKDQWSPIGKSNLWELVGEAHRHRSEWPEARNAYKHSLEAHPTQICTIFLADCYVQLDQASEAKAIIASVPVAELVGAEKTDYGFTTAAIAIEIGDKKILEEARVLLIELSIPEPYFRERRDALIVAIQEALLSGPSKTLSKRVKRILADKTRSFLSYVILKPSVMGIGLDIGKIIEDLSGHKDE
jgi:tetratricopeptide (TPR) repeat protein